MTKPNLVVLAAGIGRRYGGVKQVEPVGPGGERILDYSIYDGLRSGFGQVVFVINEAIEADFRTTIGDTIERQCPTQYVFQKLNAVPHGVQVPAGRTKPWGTGQATLLCRDAVDGPLSVINADDFYGPTSFQALHDFLVAAGDGNGLHDYCMVGYALGNTLSAHGHVARGICSVDDAGYLREVKERTRLERHGNAARYTTDGGATWFPLPLDTPVSMNMWGFTLSIFDELQTLFERFLREAGNLDEAEFFLPEAVNELLRSGKAQVKFLPTGERWVGMTYRADKPAVERHIRELVRQGFYPEKLWK